MTPSQLASLAASLKDNEAFQGALAGIRTSAMEALTTVDATNADTIREHQATVRVVDALRDQFETFIRSGRVPKPPGIA